MSKLKHRIHRIDVILIDLFVFFFACILRSIFSKHITKRPVIPCVSIDNLVIRYRNCGKLCPR